MSTAPAARDTDDESLSALSELDEQVLETLGRDFPESPELKVDAKRPRFSKATGINARDKTHGRTALHKACSRGNLDKVVDLIGRGASLDLTDNAGVTPLHEACHSGHAEVVRYLIGKGVSIGARDCEGDYPLLDAAQSDYLDVCKLLLEAGANPTTQNSKGMSALSEAEEGPVKDLLRQYSSNFESPGQNRMRITDVISVDMDTKRNDSASSPQRLSERMRPRSSQLNIDSRGARKVDLNGRDQLHQYVIEQDDDLVEQYLEIQDCDYQDNYGDTPLHSAARTKNAHICGLLLQHGAKVTLKNKIGNTSLHEACHSPQNRDVIIALLDAGASSLATNNEKMTPAEVAHLRIGENSPEARLLYKSAQKERAKVDTRKRKRSVVRERLRSESVSTDSTPRNSPLPSRSIESPRKSNQHDGSDTETALSSKTSSTTPALVANGRPQEIAVTVATSTPPKIISSTKQTMESGIPGTQFLTEFRSNCNLTHIDSSVRGSPLPPQPPITSIRERVRSPIKAASPLQVAVNAANPPTSPDITKKRSSLQNSETATAETHNHKRSKQELSRMANHVIESNAKTNTVLPNTLSTTEQYENESNSEDLSASISQLGRDMVQAIEKQNDIMMAMLQSINALVEAQKKHH